jgi:hypothetical protein
MFREKLSSFLYIQCMAGTVWNTKLDITSLYYGSSFRFNFMHLCLCFALNMQKMDSYTMQIK